MGKTKITHAQTEVARFLGYEIKTRHNDDRIGKADVGDTSHRRTVNGKIELMVPKDVVDAHVGKRMAKGKAIHRTELMNLSDYTIVRTYQEEYRGLVNYYLMARNVATLNKYHWVMRDSLLKTLAAKYETTVAKIAQKIKVKKQTPHGLMTVFRVVVTRGQDRKPLVAEFGGIPLRKDEVKELRDTPCRVWAARSDPVVRLSKQQCEMCGCTNVQLAGIETRRVLAYIDAHHVRKLADLRRRGRRELPDWKKRMIAIRRKTLIVCLECHDNIHAGRPFFSRVDKEP